MNRQLYRTILLQTLYEWDVHNYSNTSLKDYLEYIVNSFQKVTIDEKELHELLENLESIASRRVILDELIEKASPGWTIDKITVVDRNILRLGIYELLFADNELIPPKVALNESIELAKKFGGAKSNKFVNGVMGAIYKEMGEPGKDQETKKKIPDVPYEEMPIDNKGAAVVYAVDDQGAVHLGMVHDVFGYWTLAKGTIDEGETLEEGTIREVKEETNWDIEIVQKIGENEYIAYHPERGPVRKNVTYFLGKAGFTQPTLEEGTGGLDDVRWFPLEEISELSMYEDVSQMIIQSIEIITKKEGFNE